MMKRMLLREVFIASFNLSCCEKLRRKIAIFFSSEFQMLLCAMKLHKKNESSLSLSYTLMTCLKHLIQWLCAVVNTIQLSAHETTIKISRAKWNLLPWIGVCSLDWTSLLVTIVIAFCACCFIEFCPPFYSLSEIFI